MKTPNTQNRQEEFSAELPKGLQEGASKTKEILKAIFEKLEQTAEGITNIQNVLQKKIADVLTPSIARGLGIPLTLTLVSFFAVLEIQSVHGLDLNRSNITRAGATSIVDTKEPFSVTFANKKGLSFDGETLFLVRPNGTRKSISKEKFTRFVSILSRQNSIVSSSLGELVPLDHKEGVPPDVELAVEELGLKRFLQEIIPPQIKLDTIIPYNTVETANQLFHSQEKDFSIPPLIQGNMTRVLFSRNRIAYKIDIQNNQLTEFKQVPPGTTLFQSIAQDGFDLAGEGKLAFNQ